MSVRQYVGARYVPRFSDVNNGNWSSVYSYEPLTIVKNGNDYYTSKQSVPVGIAITNTDYWVKTGDYNGAIANLDTRVSSLESDVSILKSQKKTIVIFGDSWVANAPTQIPTYVANHFDCTVKNYSVAGTGFDVSGGYKDQIQYMLNDSSINLDDVRFCIIVCGLNDHARGKTAAEFAQAFNEWKVLYNNAFTGHMIPDVYWFHNYSLENELVSSLGGNPTDYWNQFRYYRTVRQTIKDIKAFDSFGFLPGTDAAWQTDNWRHPNSAGSTLYAENMCRCIDGGRPIIYNYQEMTGTIADTNVDEALRSVPVIFKVNEADFEMVVSVSLKACAQLTSGGSYVNFDKYFPARPNSPRYIDAGIASDAYDYSNKRLALATVSPIRTQFSDSSGRALTTIPTSSLQ